MEKQDELPPGAITGRDIARILRRWWPLMFLAFSGTVVSTYLLTRRMPLVFEAKSRLLVESSVPASIPPSIAGLLNGVASSPLDIELEKMKSRAFLKEVGKQAKVTYSPEELLGKVICTVKGATPIIEISTRAPSGDEAARLANAVPAVYKRYVDREASSKSSQTTQKLHEATKVLERQKDVAVQALASFSQEMGTSDPSVLFNSRAVKTVQTRGELEESVKQAGILESGIAEARRQLAQLTPTKNISTGYSLNKNPLLDALPNEINQKLTERKLLLDDFQEDSNEVKRADLEIASLKDKLARARQNAFTSGSKAFSMNPDYAAAQSRIWNQLQEQQTNARRIRENRDQLARLEAEQRRLAQRRTKFEQLAQNAGRQRALYENSRTAEIQTEMARITKLPNLKVLDEAQVPGAPLSPNLKLNLALALALGGFLALALALLAEYFFPRRLPMVAEDPLLALPHVGGVPLLGNVPAAALPGFSSGRPSLERLGARAEDALREIGYSLAHREPGQPAPVALFVGTRSDDSTASLAACLTALLLHDGLRITLVDADRATPRLHRAFGKPDAPGLAEALAGKSVAGLLHRSDGGQLRFLAAGDPADPTPLTEAGLRQVLGELASTDRTDLVVVTGPSVWNARAVSPLEKAAGGMVLIASADVPAEESVARARRLLSNGETPHIHGVIVGEVPALPAAPDVLS